MIRLHVPARPARLLMCALVALLLLGMPSASAGVRPVTTESFDVDAQTVTLLAPAVGEQQNGDLIGVTMSMEVTVQDGTGGVFVDTRPLTQVDMQGSARLAAGTAARLVGADFNAYDYYITIRSSAPTVGGPSAGATMTVGFAALLADIPLRDDVVMTGMINPDGSVGPVGGILQKAEAASNAGASVFLIPEGQRLVRQVHREVNESGWFPTVETREEQIDVVEHAKEEWGLRVREVSDVYAAFEAFTDHRIERPQPSEVQDTEAFIEIMGGASESQLAAADQRLTTLRDALAASGVEQEAPSLHASLQERLDVVDARLQRAHAAQAQTSFYTASSLVFQSNIDLSVVELWLGATSAEDERVWLTERGREASDKLEETRDRAANADPESVSSLEAVGAAQVRLLEARRLMADAEAAHSDDRLPESVQALAFALERTNSVTWWLDIANTLDARTGRAPLVADVEVLAADYLGFAQQALAYAEVLVGQAGAEQSVVRLMNEARLAQADAHVAMREDLYTGALYSAMEVQVAAFGALSLIGSPDLLDDRAARQRDAALLAIAEARNAGAEPFLALSYLDFGESLSGDDDMSALLMYGQAATIAGSSAALATGEGCGFLTGSCQQRDVSIQKASVPGPDPWTAYLALATILLGFMAGILVTLVVRGANVRGGAAAEPRDERRPPPGSNQRLPVAWGRPVRPHGSVTWTTTANGRPAQRSAGAPAPRYGTLVTVGRPGPTARSPRQ